MSNTAINSPAEREFIRTRLLEEKQRLETQLRRLQDQDRAASAQDEVSELSHYDEHPADIATETFFREQDQAIGRNFHAELHQVENALRRLDEGSYGLCERCGRPIGRERLEALPSATLCVADAERLEGQI